MSKRLFMSLISTIAMTIGGFFVSCGSDDAKGVPPVVVQLPVGCTLVSPRDELSALGTNTPFAKVKTGKNEFVLSCDGRMIQIEKNVKENEQIVTISPEEVGRE